MPFYFFIWTEEFIEYIAQHDVTPEELEQVVCNPESVEKSRSSDRLIAFAEIDGRDLACVYEINGDEVLPITAYEV